MPNAAQTPIEAARLKVRPPIAPARAPTATAFQQESLHCQSFCAAQTTPPITAPMIAPAMAPKISRPVGSTNLAGLLVTYTYRFCDWGSPKLPSTGSALTNRPISGSYWRARRYTSPVGSSCFSDVYLYASVPLGEYGFPNGS